MDGPDTPPEPKPRMTPDVMVAKFVALRDKVAAIKHEHTAQLAPYNVALSTLEGWLLEALNAGGASSMKTPDGTFYSTTRTSAKVEDWSQVLDFIRANEAWELIEQRVNKTTVEAIQTETGANIPGITVSRELVLNVRRG